MAHERCTDPNPQSPNQARCRRRCAQRFPTGLAPTSKRRRRATLASISRTPEIERPKIEKAPEIERLGNYLETTAAGNPRLNITYTQNRTPRNRTARSVDGVGAELLTFTVVRPHRPNQCSANQHILHSVKLLILENKLPNRLDGP